MTSGHSSTSKTTRTTRRALLLRVRNQFFAHFVVMVSYAAIGQGLSIPIILPDAALSPLVRSKTFLGRLKLTRLHRKVGATRSLYCGRTSASVSRSPSSSSNPPFVNSFTPEPTNELLVKPLHLIPSHPATKARYTSQLASSSPKRQGSTFPIIEWKRKRLRR